MKDKGTSDFLVDGIRTELKTANNLKTSTVVTNITKAFKNQDAQDVIYDLRKVDFTSGQIDEIISRVKGLYPDKPVLGKVQFWLKNGEIIEF